VRLVRGVQLTWQYLKAIWNVINFEEIEKRFKAAQ
jgi:superoxide dismutase